MKRKLVSLALIVAAALIPMSMPAGQGGKVSSYNTTWSMTCPAATATASGMIYLATRKGTIASSPTSCPSPTQAGGTVNTTTAPTTWTWTSTVCHVDATANSPFVSKSGSVGHFVDYNCFINGVFVAGG